MRTMTTIAMMRGSVVHQVIVEGLKSIPKNSDFTLAKAKELITELMLKRARESKLRFWETGRRPSGVKQSAVTNLLEHYYNFPDADSRIKSARQVAWAAMENLLDSDLWSQVTGINPADWAEMEDDGFPSFDLDGIQVYTKIDFAHTSGIPTIIDWKTGKPSEADRMQLALYALYAQSKWGWNPLETNLTAAYLYPDFHADSFTPSQIDIEAARELAKASFNEMLELEPVVGPAQIDNFPMTDDTWNCRWCRFQGICVGAARLESTTGLSEEESPFD